MPDFVVTSANDLHERIGLAVAALAGTITPLPVTKSQFAMIPLLDTADLPCILCSLDTDTEQQDQDFEGNMDKYPVKVGLFDRVDMHDQTNRARYLAWRKRMMDEFRSARDLGPTCPEVWNIDVKPQYIFDPRDPAYQQLVCGFTVYANTWEQRPKL